MTDNTDSDTFDAYESSSEYWNWYGYPPYPYYPYSTAATDSHANRPYWPAGSGDTASTRKEVTDDCSEGEYSDADSVSTDPPPSPKKVRELDVYGTTIWRANVIVSII